MAAHELRMTIWSIAENCCLDQWTSKERADHVLRMIGFRAYMDARLDNGHAMVVLRDAAAG
jgi:hypothetical protein